MGEIKEIVHPSSRHSESFDELFRAHYKPLCSFALKYVEYPDQAEEIVQAVFVKILESWDDHKFHTSKHSYLFQSVKNACFNYGKHLKVKADYMEHNQRQRLDEERQMESDDSKDELTRILMKEIDSLPEQCRIIFKKSKLDGMKYQEIADQMGLSVKTIENQMGKALKVLREKMKSHSSLPLEIVILKISIGVSASSFVLLQELMS